MCSWRAIARPSPPLFPLPQTTTIRCSLTGAKCAGDVLDHALRGVLHQNDSRNSGLDGGPVHLAHLPRCKNFSRIRFMPAPAQS